MSASIATRPARSIHPFTVVLLSCTVPLFLGGLLSDLAYASTYQVQWTNFAAWLIAGGVVFTGVALLWVLVGTARANAWRGRALASLLLLLGMFALGLVNSFVHARDAWGAMPAGLVLSAIVAAGALVVTAIGCTGLRTGPAR